MKGGLRSISVASGRQAGPLAPSGAHGGVSAAELARGMCRLWDDSGAGQLTDGGDFCTFNCFRQHAEGGLALTVMHLMMMEMSACNSTLRLTTYASTEREELNLPSAAIVKHKLAYRHAYQAHLP